MLNFAIKNHLASRASKNIALGIKDSRSGRLLSIGTEIKDSIISFALRFSKQRRFSPGKISDEDEHEDCAERHCRHADPERVCECFHAHIQ
jgi:hypothetical protein